ncbi:MAG: ABC transporter ATP-binding protein/permease [Anaerorhabdus sp.]|uniref:ABC transporter ATP-binding protein/permease n=1 Tax=Anaerorhabdus sp. TaxID=1872524 RepID=UPI003A8B4D28
MLNKRLIKEMKSSMKYVKRNVIYQWLSLISNIILIITGGYFINNLIEEKITTNSLIILIVITIMMIVIRSFCMIQSSKMSYCASKEVKRNLRENIYRKILKLGSSYTSKISTAEIVQMSSEGIEQLENYFGSYLPQFFYSLVAPITLFICIAPISLKVATILLICVPLIPISIVLVQKFAKKLLKKYWGQYTTFGDSFLENLQGLTTLKIYQADESRHKKMNQEAENSRKVTMRVLIMQLNSISVMDLVAYGASALGIIVAIEQMIRGNLTLAQGFIIVVLSAEFFLPLRLLGSYFHIAMNGIASSDKIFKFLDLPQTVDGTLDFEAESVIELEKISFTYGNKEILKDVSLTVQKGKITTLIGESGSGKSTITSLLMKKLFPNKGTIKIGTVDLKDITQVSLMDKVTLVNLNSYVFKGTIRENLMMGKRNADDEELWDILDKVDLKEFFESQAGLETFIQEKGSNLSGGQNQRVVLARALLHDSEVYIFDEATSNIDSESENKILNLIYELSKSKAVLLITHRLKNALNASEIIVLDEGKIIGQGNHEILIKNNEKYKEYWKTQNELENLELEYEV